MVNKPLIRPYFLGGGSFGGGWLNSHDYTFDGICRFAVPVARVHFRGCSFDLSHIMLQRHQKPVNSHKNIIESS